jgi:hypothetical protein
MSGGGPTVQRGALATVRNNTLGDIVQFQYNPESIARTFTPRMSWGAGTENGAPSLQSNLLDAPGQSIVFKAYFDAADALAAGDRTAAVSGIAPQLAVLESFLYPTRDAFQRYESQRGEGMKGALMQAPRTILVWGERRVYPVRLTNLAITEEAFNAALSPIRASAQITVEVVTYGMRTQGDNDYKLFGAYHVGLERLAKSAAVVDSRTRSSLASRAKG